ncbi:head-tail adaptor protein [Sphingobium yanoikuyae]|uniref:Head-tail adaptor protein n=1 Tax=Sphingobium yanoikuyae TaxID=13690 RepID=A0A3G2UZ41_SPHYA|nr:head-tail adaptor protein [Sphingobium yanoikuyae]AYO80115.1 head-tail adaptor protein [Sphingobium yanoikuyae]
MKASRRDRLIIIEFRTVARDGYNAEIPTWSEYCRAYAAVYYGTGKEQREAAQVRGSQVASFEVLSDSKSRAISLIDHRVSFDGGTWNITAKQDLGLNDGVRLTAVREVS